MRERNVGNLVVRRAVYGLSKVIEDLQSTSDARTPLAAALWLGPGRLVAAAVGALLAISVVFGMQSGPMRAQRATAAPTASTAAVATDRVGNLLGPITVEQTWTVLSQRPLRLTTLAGIPCPVTPFRALQGSATGLAAVSPDGPIYAVTGGTVIGLGAADSQGRRGGKILWVSNPDYGGPAIIRGARLDAPGDLVFTDGRHVLEFDYDTHVRAGDATTGSAVGYRYLPSEVYVSSPGCYGFQIDVPNGENFIVLMTSN